MSRIQKTMCPSPGTGSQRSFPSFPFEVFSVCGDASPQSLGIASHGCSKLLLWNVSNGLVNAVSEVLEIPVAHSSHNGLDPGKEPIVRGGKIGRITWMKEDSHWGIVQDILGWSRSVCWRSVMNQSPVVSVPPHVRPFPAKGMQEIDQDLVVDLSSDSQTIGHKLPEDQAPFIKKHNQHEFGDGDFQSHFGRSGFSFKKPLHWRLFWLRIPCGEPGFVLHHDVLNWISSPSDYLQRSPCQCHTSLLLLVCEEMRDPASWLLLHLEVFLDDFLCGSVAQIDPVWQLAQSCSSVSIQDISCRVNLSNCSHLGSSGFQSVIRAFTILEPVDPPLDTQSAESIGTICSLDLSDDILLWFTLFDKEFDLISLLKFDFCHRSAELRTRQIELSAWATCADRNKLISVAVHVGQIAMQLLTHMVKRLTKDTPKYFKKKFNSIRVIATCPYHIDHTSYIRKILTSIGNYKHVSWEVEIKKIACPLAPESPCLCKWNHNTKTPLQEIRFEDSTTGLGKETFLVHGQF